MTLLNIEEAAAFLKYKNPNSLYNNKKIPRVYAGRLVRFVKEELEQWLQRDRVPSQDREEKKRKPGPLFRIKVPR